MLSSTSTLRSPRASRHFRPARLHCANAQQGGPEPGWVRDVASAQLRGGLASHGRIQLAPAGVGVPWPAAQRVRLGQPPPGGHHRGPVRQREVVLDGRAQVIDGPVQVPRVSEATPSA
jgi:hypothetical protein